MGILNTIVIVVYLLGITLVGAYFAKKSGKNTDRFFKAGGKIPAWAAGISIWATTLSAITFMAIPAMAYQGDWLFAVGNMSIVLVAPFVFHFCVPFFRKLEVTTAYEYLEHRFNVVIRLFGSVLFMLFHISRVAIVIYLPTLAITTISGDNPYLVASVIGILCIIYTFLGGMEGVIWSDVIQGFILLGGLVIALIVGLYQVPGGIRTTFSYALAHGKLLSANQLDWSFVKLTIPTMLVGSFFINLYAYVGSQDVVQRYNTTPTLKATGHSLYLNAFMAFVSTLLFFSMGTVLYVFYHFHAGLRPVAINSDSIFPYFIIHVLPSGISGLIIAAIFAAAQSTISSSLNSISACFSTDIVRRFFVLGSEKSAVMTARFVIIIVGIIAMAVTFYMIQTDQSELLKTFQSALGLFGAPIAGVFLLGFFTKRANGLGCIIGVLASVIALLYAETTALTFLYYGMIGVGCSFCIGYLASVLFPSDKQVDAKLTIYG